MGDTYGILGFPVAHSRSPQMQRAAFERAGIDADYVRFPVPPEALPQAVAGLWALGIAGANVTLPHKRAVMDLVAHVTPQARAIGAVNTLVRGDDGFTGHNTDAPGLARSLVEAGVKLSGSRVAVIGAGGAARAAVVGLAERGAGQIHVAARRVEQAQALVRDVETVCAPCALSSGPLDAMAGALDAADLWVQSTSATLEGQAGADAFAASLPWHGIAPGGAVVDLVYKPRETSVLAAARARGLKCVDGLGMLLHQGALAFELWTGATADVAAMARALEA